MLDIRNLGQGHKITQVSIIKDGAIKAISYVYYGANLVWQAVRSCFGSKFWVNEKPWLNEEGWKNNEK